jgi:hypothetical protein
MYQTEQPFDLEQWCIFVLVGLAVQAPNPTSVPERGGDECLCSGPDLPVSNPNKTIVILDSMDAS